LSTFVMVETAGTEAVPTLAWVVGAARRRELETTRLGRRVLCTDRHSWSTERIVSAFRGQWNVEENLPEGEEGRRPTVLLAPELTHLQKRAVRVFELARWVPTLASCSPNGENWCEETRCCVASQRTHLRR
jgi:hypothetical protein